MPQSIYDIVGHKDFAKSSITGRKLRVNADGMPAIQNKYLWGSRLPAGLAPMLKPSHKTDPYAGMVRMKTDKSRYLTFRTMSENSTGWIVPAKPGHYIVRDLVAKGQKALEDRISQALKNIGV